MIRAAGLTLLLAGPAGAQEEITPFVRNVVTHVVLHELAHALIREFDLPVLGNEEVIADDFATLFAATRMPGRAEAIVHDRARSWLVEAGEGPPDLGGEHPPDARRALRAVCMLHGIRGHEVPDWIDLDEGDLEGCREAAPEIARSWRRVLEPYGLPEGLPRGEFRLAHGAGPMEGAMRRSRMMEELGEVVGSFDWHSQVTLHFDHCDGAAAWIRNGRTIELCDAHVARLDEQEARAPG